MGEYHLFFLGPDDHIVNREARSFRDDLAALDRARKLAKDHAIEIWQDERRVALVKAGDAPLSVCDRASL